MGCLLYADDILLISQSVECTQKMLDKCAYVLKQLDLKFNVKKCMVLRIGPRFKNTCQPLTLDGQQLKYVDEIKYLGVHIMCASAFKCSYAQCKLKFYRCFNAMYAKSKSASSELVSMELCKSQCLPLVFYATQAIVPGKSDIKILDKLINHAVGKIFSTYDRDIISDIRLNCCVLPSSTTIHSRHAKFCDSFFAKSLSFSHTILCVNKKSASGL